MEIFTTRHNLHIDPYITLWGYEIAIYLFLGGIAAGAMIINGLIYVADKQYDYPGITKWSLPLPFVLISIGMLFLLLDLENKLNLPSFYMNFNITSPMSFGAWILLIVYPVSIILFILSLRNKTINDLPFGNKLSLLFTLLFKRKYKNNPIESEKANDIISTYSIGKVLAKLLNFVHKDDIDKFKDQKNKTNFILNLLNDFIEFCLLKVKPIAWTSIIIGAVIGIYTGILLSSMSARPFWNSGILGFLFLISGISTALALLTLMPTKKFEKKLLAKADVFFIILEIVLLTSFIINLVLSYKVHQQGIYIILGGTYTAHFWSLVVIAGLIIPLIIEIIEIKGLFKFDYFVQPLFVLLGGISLRFIIVYAGQSFLSTT